MSEQEESHHATMGIIRLTRELVDQLREERDERMHLEESWLGRCNRKPPEVD